MSTTVRSADAHPRRSPHPENPIGNSGEEQFVGRSRELATLEARIVDSSGGRGGVIALGGEPGIGKTSLARVLAERAANHGSSVLWGRCFDGEWVPPYGPWIEVIDGYLRSVDRDVLQSDLEQLGSVAAPLARLVPSLAADLAAPPPAWSQDPAEERYRLHEAVSQFLIAIGQRQPQLVILDDLHWADGPSLALLRHLGRSRVPTGTGFPLLIVAVFRDGVLAREHPLTAVLAGLRREPGFLDLELKGIDDQAVSQLLTHDTGGAIDPELARIIHHQTGGNPFFVREVMRHLREERLLVKRSGQVGVDGDAGSLGVSEGVRQVVGSRLLRLANSTRQLLDGAAVFTATIDPSVLRELCGFTDSELFAALDEAITAQFIRPAMIEPDRFEFAHAIVREALVAERTRNPRRAAHTHRQMAEAMERVHQGRSLMDAATVAELAVQYHASRSVPGAARGVPHALAVAERAAASFSHERTVAFLRIARDLATELDPAERAEILARLAVAEAEALLLSDAAESLREAFATFHLSSAPAERLAEFAATIAAALKLGGADDGVWRPLVERGLTLVADDHGLTWARLRFLDDPMEVLPGGPVRAARWLGFDPEAVAVVRRLGNEDDYAHSVDSFDPRTRAETRSLIALARRWPSPSASLRTLSAAANDLQYRHGDHHQALDLWQEIEALADRSGAFSWRAQACNQLSLLFLTFGDLEVARDAAARATELLDRLGPQGGISGDTEVLDLETVTCLAYLVDGDWAEIAARWQTALAPTNLTRNYVTALNGPFFAGLAALATARADRAPEAVRIVESLAPLLAALPPALSTQGQNGAIAFAGEAIWSLGLTAQASLYHRLARQVVEADMGDYPLTSNALTVARMSALLNHEAETRTAFASARSSIEQSGQRPLEAILDHDEALALVRLDPQQIVRPLELLRGAAGRFRELGMVGWADRAENASTRIARPTGHRPFPAGISEREAEVLKLVARGYGDRQIAERLFISPRTVNAHVRNLLSKTERANRTELSVWAAEQGLAGVASLRTAY